MSFEINWDLLKDGLQQEILRTEINERFKTADRPSFIGPLEVTELAFGDIPPEVALIDVCDPKPEFYDSEIQSYMDTQIELSVKYKGNIHMTIETSLIVNQPTENFMTMPISLSVKGCHIEGVAIVACMSDGFHFCLKPIEQNQEIVHELVIESALGSENKLNSGKIEKFILQQLRAFLVDYMVFPNYHSIYLDTASF